MIRPTGDRLYDDLMEYVRDHPDESVPPSWLDERLDELPLGEVARFRTLMEIHRAAGKAAGL